MGEVWLAHHEALNKDFAIKILRPKEAGAIMAMARFEQEVYATSQLSHPNTIRIFDFGRTEDNLYYYTMEYVPGVDLHDIVSHEGPMAVPRALTIISQAARALAEAHQHGIVHRDIKPANMVLRKLGKRSDFVKVLDFGLAKLTESKPAQELTRVGWAVGTPQYVSPEVILGGAIDGRSDIYALGSVLYFLLTGGAPFNMGKAMLNMRAQIEKTPLTPSKKLGRPVNKTVEGIVMRCLEKKPERRFQDANDLADALDHALIELTSPGTVRNDSVAKRAPRVLPHSRQKRTRTKNRAIRA
jgi:serine/threonine-protein kinase